MRQALPEPVAALLRMMATRDVDLLGHSRRVGSLALEMGRALPIDDAERAVIHYGALLHDVGKVLLPPHVLQKPGPLTAAERALVHLHPALGYEIVSAVPAMERAARVVLGSHERFDGTGYPQGLRGRAIPIGARVVAVADAFDVLTQGRAYSSAVSLAAAGAELARQAGSQFDPDVVRVWFQLSEPEYAELVQASA
jgi:HD-GYP domain-containing protein (c-di-GMP phosphodiesterase class II)